MYAIHYDQTGYWDFVQCDEFPVFKKEADAWAYLESRNLCGRYLVFKIKDEHIKNKKENER